MQTSGDLKSGDSIICIIHPEKYQFILYCLTKKIIEIIFFLISIGILRVSSPPETSEN